MVLFAGSFAGFQYDISAKSGTAEDYTHTGNVDHPNHLFISYGPSKDPQVVVAVLEERLKGANDAPSIAKKHLVFILKNMAIIIKKELVIYEFI